MNPDRPSLTAQRVAMRRAVHQILDQPLVLEDPLVAKIYGESLVAEVRDKPGQFETSKSRALRAFLVARSRFAEDELAKAVGRGVTQYVLLGAGMDTFAYRHPHPAHLWIFEVDHPATQGWKRRRLEETGIAIPSLLTFVPVNFEGGHWGTSLLTAGFKLGEPSFFSWLGVSMYLAPEGVLATVETVASLAGPGSGLVFDYLLSPSLMGPEDLASYQALAARVASAGEPWLSAFDPGPLAGQLEEMGFAVAEDLDQEKLNERYFKGRSDGLRVSGRARLIRVVKGE